MSVSFVRDRWVQLVTAKAIAVVHRNSPIVDAGEDKFCTTSPTGLGSDELPTGGGITYSWAASTGTISPSTSKTPTYSATGTGIGVNCVMTATQGTCEIKDTAIVSINVIGVIPDAYIEDIPGDGGVEPQTIDPWHLYDGTDIWVRNQQEPQISVPS